MSSAAHRPVTLFITSSLDGFIARRDGSADWLPAARGEKENGFAEFLADVDTVIAGRRTYDLAREREGPVPFGGRRCIVLSRRRAGTRGPRVQFTADEPAEVVRTLRDRRGRGIWIAGGGEIVRECLEAGVVNSVILSVAPLLLGDGVPLFLSRGGTTRLQLRATRSFAGGVVQLSYDVGSVPRAEREPSPATRAWTEPEVDSSRLATAAVGAEMLRAWALRASAA